MENGEWRVENAGQVRAASRKGAEAQRRKGSGGILLSEEGWIYDG